MKKPAKNFFDDDTSSEPGTNVLNVADGFRFGLGFMMAWAVAAVIIGGVAYIVTRLFHLA